MMIECDGVIFDVDGTLWDSTGIVKDAWNTAIEDAGYGYRGITAERLKGLFGLPMDDIIRDIMPDISPKEREEIAPFVYKYEDEFLRRKMGEVYPEITDVVRKISEKIPVFIVSNCQAGYIELFMEKTGVGDCVKAHLCPADTNLLKAGNISKIINDYSLSSPLYVGDTIMDEMACREAKCPFCFAKYGFGEADEPDYVILQPVDLLKLLL